MPEGGGGGGVVVVAGGGTFIVAKYGSAPAAWKPARSLLKYGCS
jgi:hypothetical protein